MTLQKSSNGRSNWPEVLDGRLRDGIYYRWSQVAPLERLPFMFICKTSKLAANIARAVGPASIGYSDSIWDVVGEGGRRLEVNRHPFKLQMPWKQGLQSNWRLHCCVPRFSVLSLSKLWHWSWRSGRHRPLAPNAEAGSFREAYLSFRNRPR